jgi:hypothetical protein
MARRSGQTCPHHQSGRRGPRVVHRTAQRHGRCSLLHDGADPGGEGGGLRPWGPRPTDAVVEGLEVESDNCLSRLSRSRSDSPQRRASRRTESRWRPRSRRGAGWGCDGPAKSGRGPRLRSAPLAHYLLQHPVHPLSAGWCRSHQPAPGGRSIQQRPAYRRARCRPRTDTTTTCSVWEAPETSSRTRQCSACLRSALRRHRRDQSATTARPDSPARAAHSITGCPRMEASPDEELVAEAKGGTDWASSRRDWRRASARKGEPGGTRGVTRDSVAESKRRRRPGRTTWLHSPRRGGGGTPSMYASQHTPSPSVSGIDSVRGLPRG